PSLALPGERDRRRRPGRAGARDRRHRALAAAGVERARGFQWHCGRHAMRLAIAALLFVTSCGHCGHDGGTTPPAQGGLPRGMPDQTNLAPSGDSEASQTLARQLSEQTAQGMNADDLKLHCTQLWEDVIEGGHCSKAVGDFCAASCTTDADKTACASGR